MLHVKCYMLHEDMNIKISHNWLLEYLDTNANPYEIQKYLSLCGPSVDQVEKVGNDYVYDIEITSNRIDSASVLGIAQECQAILPMFGKKAKIKQNPLEKYRFSLIEKGFSRNHQLNIKIKDRNLCSRFSAIILDDIEIKSSPDFIKQRLTVCGIKSINNVVDISNYLMIALGQPTHIFDYDKIGNACMIMRESKNREKIITLDEKEVILPGGDIVIEDGDGKLVDLCGIMGGFNSAVSNKTKKIILFVQTYNKEKIRRTSMLTGRRTVASTYFEKGLDEERVEQTLVYGVELLEKYANVKVSSQLYDIYPHPYKEKLLVMSYGLLEKIVGVEIKKKEIETILQNLGFRIYHLNNDRDENVKIGVPSYRKNDINIKEDIIEEVARIYGYHNLPNRLSPAVYVKQPKEFAELFNIQRKIKLFLKHLGLNEVVNYSMISRKMIKECKLGLKDHLRISNTISEDIEYLRVSLIPSLIKNIKENTGKREVLKFFEIAKVYYPQKNNLPNEVYKLAIAVNTNFFDLKGIIEALYKELNIEEDVSEKIIIKDNIFLVEIDLKNLINSYNSVAKYRPINPYAVVKLDLTVKLSKDVNFTAIKKLAFKISQLLQKIEVIDIFRDKTTLRFYFSSLKRNVTEDEAKKELKKIKNLI